MGIFKATIFQTLGWKVIVKRFKKQDDGMGLVNNVIEGSLELMSLVRLS